MEKFGKNPDFIQNQVLKRNKHIQITRRRDSDPIPQAWAGVMLVLVTGTGILRCGILFACGTALFRSGCKVSTGQSTVMPAYSHAGHDHFENKESDDY